MARRTAKMLIIRLMKAICHLVGRYGVSAVVAYTGSPAIGAALTALNAACMAWEDNDDRPGEVDEVDPSGPEDPPGTGEGPD